MPLPVGSAARVALVARNSRVGPADSLVAEASCIPSKPGVGCGGKLAGVLGGSVPVCTGAVGKEAVSTTGAGASAAGVALALLRPEGRGAGRGADASAGEIASRPVAKAPVSSAGCPMTCVGAFTSVGTPVLATLLSSPTSAGSSIVSVIVLVPGNRVGLPVPWAISRLWANRLRPGLAVPVLSQSCLVLKAVALGTVPSVSGGFVLPPKPARMALNRPVGAALPSEA